MLKTDELNKINGLSGLNEEKLQKIIQTIRTLNSSLGKIENAEVKEDLMARIREMMKNDALAAQILRDSANSTDQQTH